MKRRVLRAHANKRCLRILSASHQLRTPSTADRAYAVLCDASFLRAVVLAYWQAHAPAEWRESRKRQLRKAAAAVVAAGNAPKPIVPVSHRSPSAAENPGDADAETEPKDDEQPTETKKTGRSSNSGSSNEQGKSSRLVVNVAAIISHLPVQLPSYTPVDYLHALMNDAFLVNGDAASTNKSHPQGSGGGRDGASDSEDDDAYEDGERGEKRAKGSRSASPSAKNVKQATNNSSSSNNKKTQSFVFHCLPETLTMLRRMHDSSSSVAPSPDLHTGKEKASDAPSAASSSDNTSSHRQRMSATQRWLASSLGNLATGSSDENITGGSNSSSDAPLNRNDPLSLFMHQQQQQRTNGGGGAVPFTFQEIPAAVVEALLKKMSLLQDPSTAARVEDTSTTTVSGSAEQGKEKSSTSSSSQPKSSCSTPAAAGQTQAATYRNEAKAIADFMDYNSHRLLHGDNAVVTSTSPLAKVRLCGMPAFVKAAPVVLGHHALKRQRRLQRLRDQTAGVANTTQQPNTVEDTESFQEDASTSASPKPQAVSKQLDRPYVPRTYFVATQNHDVRRRLPAATALLRLTTNPDALWIEQRGTAYHYGDDTSMDAREHDGERRSSSKGRPNSQHLIGDVDRHPRRAFQNAQRYSRTGSAHSPASSSATPTVVSAAPQLSRADVAFMKHLGTATHVPLPDKTPTSALHAARSHESNSGVLQKGNASSGAEKANTAGRKRPRVKGQNPLSMKKKQKREVFRA